MKRTLLFGSILVLVALLVWVASKVPAMAPAASTSAETLGPPTPCAACAQTPPAVLTQEKINLSTLQAQAAATADILWAHSLATSNAVAAAQTPAMLKANVFWAQVVAPPYPWQANTLATAIAVAAPRSAGQIEADLQQAHLQLTSGAATQIAAAAAQRKMGQTIAPASTVAPLQARSEVAQRSELSALLWMWATPLLIIVAAVLALWGVLRWTGPNPKSHLRYPPKLGVNGILMSIRAADDDQLLNKIT